MGDKGNCYNPRLKAEIALSAYRNDETLSELSAEYGLDLQSVMKCPMSRGGEGKGTVNSQRKCHP